MRATTAGMALATMLMSTACYTMRQVALDDLGGQRTERLWVTHANQSVMVMRDAQMFRGKLVGFVDGKYQEVPSTDLEKIQVRQLATGRTVGLIAAGALGFAVGAVLLSGKEGQADPCVGDDGCDDALRVAP
jgi:hypothetical protein